LNELWTFRGIERKKRNVKKTALLILVLIFGLRNASRILGQGSFSPPGEVYFSTYNPPVDAPVTFPDGRPATEEFFAQLYAGPDGAPASSLQPLLPITTVRPDLPGFGPGYVWEVDVKIPFLPPNSYGTIVMRAFDGANWESSMWRGESAPARIKIGGGFSPPGLLIGLEGFQVHQVPEPRTFTLLLLGFAWRLFCRRHP